MVCQQHQTDSLPLPLFLTTYGSPNKSPSTSFDWDDSCREHGVHPCPCASIDAFLDVPGSLHLDEESPVESKILDSCKLRHQAWPWSEPLISDDTLSPSDFDFMTAAYPLPSWGVPQLGSDSGPEQFPTSSPSDDSAMHESAVRFREAGRASRWPSSPSSDPSDGNQWAGNSSPESDFMSSTRSATRPSKWVTKKRKGVSKAAAHNLIEKKYRSNLNEKMMALRDIIPSLSMMAEKATDDTDPQEPSRKLNKAYILTEAKDYITYLKKRNESLIRKEKDLEARIKAFQMLSRSRCSNKWAT